MMETEKITLMEAYLIETLRGDGVTNEEIEAINESNVEQWGSKHENFDFKLLLKVAEDKKRFHSILHDGYTVKFLTYNGLINLLRIRFRKVADRDYVKEEQGVSDLAIDEEQLHVIIKMLSPNWTAIRVEETGKVSIQPTA